MILYGSHWQLSNDFSIKHVIFCSFSQTFLNLHFVYIEALYSFQKHSPLLTFSCTIEVKRKQNINMILWLKTWLADMGRRRYSFWYQHSSYQHYELYLCFFTFLNECYPASLEKIIENMWLLILENCGFQIEYQYKGWVFKHVLSSDFVSLCIRASN